MLLLYHISLTHYTISRGSSSPLPYYLPPSEIPWRLFLAVLQAQKGNTHFTELAERAEYGK